MLKRPEPPRQFDLFDPTAGKPVPSEEIPLEPPPAPPEERPTEADEREATEAMYGPGARYVPPQSSAARKREREARRRTARDALRKILGLPPVELFPDESPGTPPPETPNIP